MRIISHRGLWSEHVDKNSIEAFRLSFAEKFGVETDIRDFNGELVISHDPPVEEGITLSHFLSIVPSNLFLALNIKADGLAQKAITTLESAGHTNYAFFDMSIPDMQSYIKIGAKLAVRISEYEPLAVSLLDIAGTTFVWLDAFESLWYDSDYLEKLIDLGCHVLIVSEELHNRDYLEQWNILSHLSSSTQITLCTDYPIQANKFFKV